MVCFRSLSMWCPHEFYLIRKTVLLCAQISLKFYLPGLKNREIDISLEISE